MTQVDATTFDRLSPEENAAIRLPASTFAQIQDQRDLGVFVGYYESATLFPVSSPSDALKQAQVCSNVIAATVGQNMSIENLKEAVTIAFRLENKVDMVSCRWITCKMVHIAFKTCPVIAQFTAPGSEKCASWDFGLQKWTSRGCNTSTGQDGIVLCHCNHLTNFAILVVRRCLANNLCVCWGGGNLGCVIDTLGN